MPEPEQQESATKPFFERSVFKATVAVVGLLAGVWALVGAPKPWEVAGKLTDNPLPLRNTEIILDASARMGARFAGATKLAAEAAQVAHYAAGNERVGLALRRAGGSCEEEAGEPIVGFDDGQSQQIREAALEQRPQGKSNWATQVRSAIGEFGEERFHRPDSENQIVVFVGGGDPCGGRPAEEIRGELEDAEVNPTFHFFGVNVSKKEMKNLRSMARQLKQVAPVLVDNAKTVEALTHQVQEAVATGGPGSESVEGAEMGMPEEPADEGANSIEPGPPSARSNTDTIGEPEPEPGPEPAPEPGPEPEPEPAPEPGPEEPVNPGAGEEPDQTPTPPAPAEPAPELEPYGKRAGPSGTSKPLGPGWRSSRPADRSMIPMWTIRPSGQARRGKSPAYSWGSWRRSWPSTLP